MIGGVGTGGWLAILLGRYRLQIEECMSVYLDIAQAIDPTKARPSKKHTEGLPIALNQEHLINEIENIIESHDLPRCMQNSGPDISPNVESENGCRAFALGVLKHRTADSGRYHLFRTYEAGKSSTDTSPSPKACAVSAACAATAAAKTFMKEYTINRTTYLDEELPATHNISRIAIDEIASLHGSVLEPEFVLNLSSGLPTPEQVHSLERTAYKNASRKSQAEYRFPTLSRLFKNSESRRTKSENDLDALMREYNALAKDRRRSLGYVANITNSPTVMKLQSDTAGDVGQLLPNILPDFSPAISEEKTTSISRVLSKTGTNDSEKSLSLEVYLKHQRHLFDLWDYLSERFGSNNTNKGRDIYCRLQFQQPSSNPQQYLNDMSRSRDALDVAKRFVESPKVIAVFDHLERRARESRSLRSQEHSPKLGTRDQSCCSSLRNRDANGTGVTVEVA